MNPDVARMLIATAGEFSPDINDRISCQLYVFTYQASLLRPKWWRWTCMLALGITLARIEAAQRSS